MTSSESSGSITRFVHQLAADNEDERNEAAREIFARYFERLVNVATAKISPHIARREGGDDAAQSALKSFFIRQADGRFVLESRDDLTRLLVSITVHKARSVARKNLAKSRDVRRETDMGNGDSDLEKWLVDHMATTQPSAEESLLTQELFDTLPSDEHRQLALFRLQGLTDAEIAERLQCSGETIRLRRNRIGRIWSKYLTDDEQSGAE